MRKILFQMAFILIGGVAFAQNPVISITSPADLAEPYSVCFNTEVSFSADLSNVPSIIYDDGWFISTEEPDFIGLSNWDKWERTNITVYTFNKTITDDIFIWYTTNVPGGWIGSTPAYSNVIHITLNGETPQLSYSDTTFCEGSSLSIDATPSDLGDGNYRWYKDSVEITDETSASISIIEPGAYYVEAITNPSDCPDVYYASEKVHFKYIKPGIAGEFKADLQRVRLTTEESYASYQWKQSTSDNGTLVDVDGATTYSYNANISAEDLYYAVEISTDGGCTATSDRVLVNDSIFSLPVLIEPEDTFFCRDETVTLALTKEVFATYQWYKDGSMIWNATDATLEVGSNYPGGTGIYSVKVTTALDPETEMESNAVNIYFSAQPNISIVDNAPLCPGGTVSLAAKQANNEEIGGYDSYQWYFNDENDFANAVEISGASDSIIVINVPSETRYYWVATSLNGCNDVSNYRSIYEFELYPPYISKNPYDGKMCLGDTVTISVYTNDVTYQWYYNDEAIEGATEQEYAATKAGYYDIQISSTLCESAAPIMNNDSAVIAYRFNPTFSVDPEGDQWGENPNHLIFCGGDTISLMVDNATNYSSWQWMGKLFDVGSTSDEWEDMEGQTDSIYTFINGQNNKLRFKVRVDSILEDNSVCSAESDYKIIDQHVNQDPAIASYGNSELCDQGDSTLLHLGFPGDWHHMEWYVDGALVPNSNTDTIWANKQGMWTITCYPNTCPNIPHSSGIGPYVKFMPDAEIMENDTLIYAEPWQGMYNFQWYLNGEAMDMSEFDYPNFIMKEDLVPGKYTVEVSNPSECFKLSEPYLVVGVNERAISAVSIFPNPVKSELNIAITDANQVNSIVVFNSLGVLVNQINNVKNSNIVPMKDFDNGLYLIKVNYIDQSSNTYRVVKN